MSDTLQLALYSLGIWGIICVLPISLLIHAVNRFFDQGIGTHTRIEIRPTIDKHHKGRSARNSWLMVLVVMAYVVVTQLLIIGTNSLAVRWGLYVEDLSEAVALWIGPYFFTIVALILATSTLAIIRLPKAHARKFALFHALFWSGLYFMATTCYVIVYSAVSIAGVLVNQLMFTPTSLWMIGIFTWGIVLACSPANRPGGQEQE